MKIPKEKQRSELERAHIECEKVRDKHEKLIKEADRLRMNANALSPSAHTNPSSATRGDVALSPAEKAENDRLRERLDKALQVNQLLYNFLEKHVQNQFQSRDATELEAGRLAKELEKAQMHLAKQQESNEATRIEFERMSAELQRIHDKLERAEAEKESLRQQAKMLENRGSQQSSQVEKNLIKLEGDCKQLTVER